MPHFKFLVSDQTSWFGHGFVICLDSYWSRIFCSVSFTKNWQFECRYSWLLTQQIIPDLLLSCTTAVLLFKMLIRLYLSTSNSTKFGSFSFLFLRNLCFDLFVFVSVFLSVWGGGCVFVCFVFCCLQRVRHWFSDSDLCLTIVVY